MNIDKILQVLASLMGLVVLFVFAALFVSVIAGCGKRETAPASAGCKASPTCIDTGSLDRLCLDNRVYDRKEQGWTLRKGEDGFAVKCN